MGLYSLIRSAFEEKATYDYFNRSAQKCDRLAEDLSAMRMNENIHEIRDKLADAIAALGEAEVLYKAAMEKNVDAIQNSGKL